MTDKPSAGPVIYVHRSDVHEDRWDDLKAGIRSLVVFVESRQPQMATYAFYLEEDINEMGARGQGRLQLEPDDLSGTGSLVQAEPSCKFVDERKSASTQRVRGSGWRSVDDQVPECRGGGNTVMDFDPKGRSGLDRDREFTRSMTHDIRDEFTRQQHCGERVREMIGRVTHERAG